MGFSQNDKYELWRTKNFFDVIGRECRKKEHYELTAFDPVASDSLCFILNECQKQQSQAVRIGLPYLSRDLQAIANRWRLWLDY